MVPVGNRWCNSASLGRMGRTEGCIRGGCGSQSGNHALRTSAVLVMLHTVLRTVLPTAHTVLMLTGRGSRNRGLQL